MVQGKGRFWACEDKAIKSWQSNASGARPVAITAVSFAFLIPGRSRIWERGTSGVQRSTHPSPRTFSRTESRQQRDNICLQQGPSDTNAIPLFRVEEAWDAGVCFKPVCSFHVPLNQIIKQPPPFPPLYAVDMDRFHKSRCHFVNPGKSKCSCNTDI